MIHVYITVCVGILCTAGGYALAAGDAYRKGFEDAKEAVIKAVIDKWGY